MNEMTDREARAEETYTRLFGPRDTSAPDNDPEFGRILRTFIFGDVFTTGPTEAAYVINDLVKPNSVIPSHANEVATKGGKVLPNTRTDAFIKAVRVPVHVPLSNGTMSFDSAGKCVLGC